MKRYVFRHFSSGGRLVFLLLMGTTAVSCAKKEKPHDVQYQVDSTFEPFVQDFERISADQGRSVQINDLIVQFGNTPTLNETGVCMMTDNETPKIVVNQKIWNANLNTYYDKLQVIVHELGHCNLRRVHLATEMSDTVYGKKPVSLMNPYRIVGTLYQYDWTRFNQELFSIHNEF